MSFGFGSGFGASSSPFGTTSPSPFGQSAPAFGQNTSPFGATTSTGGFGQQQPSQPAFGAAPAFGASAPAFGASAPAFGATSTPAFGSTSFGAKPATGFGFGAASSPSPFGATSTPAFGASSTPAFGAAAASPFGSTSTAFGQSAPAFGAAASAPAFGQAPAFGAQPAATGFGAPATGAFGAPASGARGTRVAPWRKTQETDTSSTGTRSTVYYNSISCMPEYAGKSVEELRWEDYQDNVKGGTGGPASPGTTGGLFGAPAATPTTSASPFGAPAGSPFGATSAPAFGASSTPAFGATSAPAFGGFGGSSTPAFGAVSTPAFGFGSSPSGAPSPFGASTGSTPFGQSAPAFGATSTPAFGATSTPAFGAPPSAPSFGGFGATSAPAFGATSAPAFGASSTPAFGGFGAASTPAFGATSAPAFGAASTPGFSFGGTSTPAFGATSAPAFGAPSSGTSLFGGTSTPAFGGGGSLFGNTAAKPASTPAFSFASTPAFGATPTPAFGANTGGGGLFGAASTPAFGAPSGGGLFGGASTTTPSFSFAPIGSTPPSGGTGLALTPFGGQAPPQQPTMGGSPYGALPEAPKVTPLPEYKVGLTQRILAPPSGGPPRHVALITPRSLTPHGGGKIRPRRGATASRMSRNPAEFLAAAAGAGGAMPNYLGLSPTPGSATPGSMAGTPNGGGASNLFVPRDNPRKLFIRDTLPSTQAAGGSTVSPAMGGATPGHALRTPGTGLRITPGTRGTRGGSPNGDAGLGVGGAHENGGGAGASGGPFSGGNGYYGGLDDASLAELLPSLRRPDYYTEPSLTQLAAMARDDPSSLADVANFTVGKRGVGSVRWLDPVDVQGLDLDSIVNLSRGAVEVYLDDENKPEVGDGLNRPAEVTMLKVFKIDKETGRPTQDPESVERFTRKLKKVAAEQGARFVSYDGASGTWKFEVEHFSRYGLVGDDSDEENEGEDDANKPGPSNVGRKPVGGVKRGGSAGAGSFQHQHQQREHEQDFRNGGGRTAAVGSFDEEEGLVSSSAEDDDDYFTGLGVVRRAGTTKSAGTDVRKFSAQQQQQRPTGVPRSGREEAVVAGMEEEEGLEGEEMEEGEGGGAGYYGEESGRYGPSGTSGYDGAGGRERALAVSLPERMDVAPEDLLRIRSGMYPGISEQQAAKQRRVDVDLGGAPGAPSHLPSGHQFDLDLDLDLDLQGTGGGGIGGVAEPRPTLAARNAWRRQARAPLRPPTTPPTSQGAGASALSGEYRAAPAVPALPYAPMPTSPAGPALSSPCPVKTPSRSKQGALGSTFARNRCIPDSGLFLGASFKAGWGPNGVFCSQDSSVGGSAARVALRRVVIGSEVVQDPATDERRDVLRRRLKEFLRVHYNNSLPDNGRGNNEFSAPRWRLQCSRSGGGLRQLTQRFIKLCNDQAAAIPGPEYQVDRTVLRHQAAAWELLHALFSSLPADEDYAPSPTSTNGEDDDVMGGDDLPNTQALAAIQRRAELSRWLRDRSRSTAERAAHAVVTNTTTTTFGSSSSSSDSAPQRVLALLSGHQLAPAVAAAATTGDVRLATLVATAGATTAAREQVAAQLAVWKDAGFDAYVDPQRRQIYQLLAGQIDAVVPSMQLDWRRALGCYLWYGCHPDSNVSDAVKAYQTAVKAGIAPGPIPQYLELLNSSTIGGTATGTVPAAAAFHDVMDTNFELIRLYCTLVDGTNSTDPADFDEAMDDSSAMSTSVGATLARLLRPAGITPDPLDYSFSWYMLCVLHAINAVPGNDDDYNNNQDSSLAAAIAHMAFISQLESLGELTHWAIYVALHLSDAVAREKTVKELLARHCPEWKDEEDVNLFLTESLNIPLAWLAEAKALWAQYNKDDVTELNNLIEAGDMAAAHAKLCEVVAPAWLLDSPLNDKVAEELQNKVDILATWAADIDALLGAGTWNRGVGVYRNFLALQDVYGALFSRSGTAGGAGSSSLADDLPPYEVRMQACDELAQQLNDATAVLAAAGSGGAREAPSVPLRRAALAQMSDRLATFVMSDALGEAAMPGPTHAALVSGLRSLRHGKVAAAVQSGASTLAGTLA